MTSISEFVGGMCLIAGVLFRPACALISFTMLSAVIMNLRGGYGFSGGSEALEPGVICLSLILTGPGKFTLLRLFLPKQR